MKQGSHLEDTDKAVKRFLSILSSSRSLIHLSILPILWSSSLHPLSPVLIIIAASPPSLLLLLLLLLCCFQPIAAERGVVSLREDGQISWRRGERAGERRRALVKRDALSRVTLKGNARLFHRE
ncbi:unnamed protein product [Pleuronectes platessa]|uniref:Uncharacterized protein n=1 Tax=Pleuronectes platessa TaxID=8262 RepID=A0A9N7Z7W1_PLEPL|nr:unnamed protein product [Pleuronectes platessa]